MADQDDLVSDQVERAKQRGLRLKRAREKKGLTQTELAAMVGRDKGTIWRYETARSQIPSETLMRMADALGVPAGWLMNGIAEAQPSTVHATLKTYLMAQPTISARVTEPLREFLATPFASKLTTEERDLLEAYQQTGFVGDPTPTSMQFLVMAMRAEQKLT